MASQTFSLGFSQGNFLYWNWTTQAANQVIITLADSTTTYINNVSRQSTNPLVPAPITGGSNMNGNNLKLTINIPASSSFKPLLNISNIQMPGTNTGIQIFTIAIEDSTDNDYNDVWFSIVGWNTTG
jgi:hypothetical protein